VFLSAIRAPTLLIDGGASPFKLMDREARRSCLTGAIELTIPDAGHLIHHDAPDALAGALRDFFAEDA
jgi:pimeloyl-ACP methyl ester carboxylesterase